MDLTELRDDGDTIDLEDGRKLRLRIEPDMDAQINDFDSYGKIEWGTKDQNSGHEQRPKGFNGNAEKLSIYSGGVSLWWQPPEGMTAKRGTEAWRQERSAIRDLAEYGFKGVILEVLDGEDAYHRPIVTKTASLWGIDSFDHGYLTEVLGDLATELGIKEGE